MKTPNAYVIYEGPSELDGKPIVAIATGYASASANAKTGAMIQTWILRADISPQEAVKTGADASVCGNCRHRGTSCYVKLFQAPRAVWSAYTKGRYGILSEDAMAEANRGRQVRIGSYGDPAAVPEAIWRAFTRHAGGWTGYTHQWRQARHLRNICMASVDSELERRVAAAEGWRTFRVREATAPLLVGKEIACPASAESGKKTACERCGLCSGSESKSRKSISIIVHGSSARRFSEAA